MKTQIKTKRFEHGEPVRIISDKTQKLYDFGYYSATEGFCVLYEHGECNMQDSFAIKLDKITEYEQ